MNGLSKRFAILALALLAGAAQPAAQTVALDLTPSLRCQAPSPGPAQRALLADLAQRTPTRSRADGIIQIPVAFHVITTGDAVSQGNVPQAWIDAQMNVLNTVFFPLGYRLVRVVQERTENAEWWNIERGSNQEAEMKQALARDPASFLNIYSTRTAGDALGWAYLPGAFSTDPAADEADPLHGLVIRYDTMPGGDGGEYDRGDTAVHEMGHFLGLLHTFEGWTPQAPAGGCSVGDGVDDTPFEASPNFTGCDVARDTCPTQSGTDPVRNFMDFSPDLCLNAFSNGQVSRMASLFDAFKPTMADGPLTFVREEALDFGPVPVGQTVTRRVQVTNLGGPPLTITQLLTTDEAFEPVLDQILVTAGATVEVEITFTPSEVDTYQGLLSMETTDANVGTLTVPLSGAGVLAPSVTVDPAGLSVSLEPDEQATLTVALGNDGLGTLEYQVVGGATAGGQTDAFGYTWLDSQAPLGPRFEALDLATSGATDLALGDDDAALVQLPFSMPFYGEPFDQVYVGSNGFLSFGAPSIAFENVAIPTPGEPERFVAPYWDDLVPTSASQVLVQDLSDGRYAVQWDNLGAFETAGAITFQAILSASGDITFQYLANSLEAPGATIGIENGDGTQGLEVARDVSFARAGRAVRFTTSASWVLPPDPPAGFVGPGDEATLNVPISAAGLAPGVYQDLIDISTNDPERERVRLHTVLSVGGLLAPPALASPRYGAPAEPTAVTLRWLEAQDATRYLVQLATDAEFTDVVETRQETGLEATVEVQFGTTYFWRVRSLSTSVSPWSVPFVFTTAVFVAGDDLAEPSGTLRLGASYPNPATDTVTLPFTLASDQANVRVTVFDVVGRRVARLADGAYTAGTHRATWQTTDVPAGVYIVRLESGSQVATGRILVLR